jgi:hypothetical protein
MCIHAEEPKRAKSEIIADLGNLTAFEDSQAGG